MENVEQKLGHASRILLELCVLSKGQYHEVSFGILYFWKLMNIIL